MYYKTDLYIQLIQLAFVQYKTNIKFFINGKSRLFNVKYTIEVMFSMKRIAVVFALLITFSSSGFLVEASVRTVLFKDNRINDYEVTMKQDLLCLMMAYPEYIAGIEGRNGGSVYLVMKSGKKILYDDKKNKNSEEKLNNPDIQDMMEQIYPLSSIAKLMANNLDPGRRRSYSLLKEVYGGSKKQVEENLMNVKVTYKNYQFNRNNKAGNSLKIVLMELMALAKTRQNIRINVFPCSGTYNYRIVAGTNRLSPHSFGIAIDLASNKKDYWKWATTKQGEERIASYPKEIVEIFEKNNFIWGGKWAHFDIMHFEYRPEIIIKAKSFGAYQAIGCPWYKGVDYEEASIKKIIRKIDDAIK